MNVPTALNISFGFRINDLPFKPIIPQKDRFVCLLLFNIFSLKSVHKSSNIFHSNSPSKETGSPNSVVSLDSAQMTDTSPLVKQSNKKKAKKKKAKSPCCKCVLPWWFVFVAWLLCLATAVAAGFFTLLWGLSFERVKQEEWLVSLFVSIVNDIFISQPLKVICFAIFFALVFKKPQEEEDDVINAELAQDEEWLQQNLAQSRGANPKEPLAYRPPNQVSAAQTASVKLLITKFCCVPLNAPHRHYPNMAAAN